MTDTTCNHLHNTKNQLFIFWCVRMCWSYFKIVRWLCLKAGRRTRIFSSFRDRFFCFFVRGEGGLMRFKLRIWMRFSGIIYTISSGWFKSLKFSFVFTASTLFQVPPVFIRAHKYLVKEKKHKTSENFDKSIRGKPGVSVHFSRLHSIPNYCFYYLFIINHS